MPGLVPGIHVSRPTNSDAVGWAKARLRAVPTFIDCAREGGHASLCPPYASLREERGEGEETTSVSPRTSCRPAAPHGGSDGNPPPPPGDASPPPARRGH